MIKFGIIGTNWITDRFIDAAKQHNEFQLTAIYSRTEERAQEFANKYHVQTIFTDIEKMASSREIDAVYIASPNSFHFEQAIMFMNYGKHVLCEKPFASNSKEVNKMIAASSNNNVVLMEAVKSTLLPAFQSLKTNLHKIGQIRNYFASYCQYSSRYDAYKQGTILNAFNPIYSNGALMDLGVYCIYPMVVLFGSPTTIKANAYMLKSGVDGHGTIGFSYDNMNAEVIYSKVTNSYLHSEIQGEEGSILIDKIHGPENIEIRYKDGSVEDISAPIEKSEMYYEVEEFIKLIKEGEIESAINSHTNSLATINLLDEVRNQIGLVFPADKR